MSIESAERSEPSIRIGLLEDDTDQAEYVTVLLEDVGYSVGHSTTGPEFVRDIQSSGFDLLILDWEVPHMDGMDILNWVRRNIQWHMPVLFLTAFDKEEHIVKALESGADDYLVKPFKPQEFLARIKALARRAGLVKRRSPVIEVGRYRLDRKLRHCWVDGERVALTKREFELACFLFDNIGKILSREYLLKQVWSMSSAVNTRTVDTHISRIRSKLNLRPPQGWRLSSVYHFGYRLERLSESGENAEEE